MNPTRLDDRRSGLPWGWVLPLLAFALIIALIFVLRYRGYWIDQDTSVMTAIIENVRQQGVLLPSTGRTYQHGFGYQAVSAFILNLTGLPAQTLQTIVWPLLSGLGLALAALVFFGQAARDRWTAFLASLLLFFQGDLLFVILRGSHEKLDWPIMMIALALLIRSTGRSLRRLGLHVLLFYLAVFLLMSVNVFFASTFLVAIVLSLLLGVGVGVIRRRWTVPADDLRRLLYVALSCILILFIVGFYLYPPTLKALRELASIGNQLGATMLGFNATENPYEYISYGWISHSAYLGLTLFTWMLVAGSFIEWLYWAWAIFRGERTLGIRENLVWLLYAGFAIQVAIGIVVDMSGALSQNMQLRVFPGFTVMAVVLFAHGVRRLSAAGRERRRLRFALSVVAVPLVAWLAIAPLLKALNEPVLSNRWGFYSISEAGALEWADGHLRSAQVWTGHDERLYETGAFWRGGSSSNNNTFRGYRFKGYENYILYSERERLRGFRMGLAMPVVLGWNRAYDNGDVYLYHRRPLTPYQR